MYVVYVRPQVADSSTTKQYLFKRSLQVAHRRRKLLEEGKAVGPALELQYRLLDKVETPENLGLCLPGCMPRIASILFGKFYLATRLLIVVSFRATFSINSAYLVRLIVPGLFFCIVHSS